MIQRSNVPGSIGQALQRRRKPVRTGTPLRSAQVGGMGGGMGGGVTTGMSGGMGAAPPAVRRARHDMAHQGQRAGLPPGPPAGQGGVPPGPPAGQGGVPQKGYPGVHPFGPTGGVSPTPANTEYGQWLLGGGSPAGQAYEDYWAANPFPYDYNTGGQPSVGTTALPGGIPGGGYQPSPPGGGYPPPGIGGPSPTAGKPPTSRPVAPGGAFSKGSAVPMTGGPPNPTAAPGGEQPAAGGAQDWSWLQGVVPDTENPDMVETGVIFDNDYDVIDSDPDDEFDPGDPGDPPEQDDGGQDGGGGPGGNGGYDIAGDPYVINPNHMPDWMASDWIPEVDDLPMDGGEYGFWAPNPQQIAGPSGLENWASSNVGRLWENGSIAEALDMIRRSTDLAGARVQGRDIVNDPAIQQALENFSVNVAPAIQHSFSLGGLGRSTAPGNTIAREQAAMLVPLYQDAFKREENRLARGAQGYLQGGASLAGLSANELARKGGVLDQAMGMGGVGRGIAQDYNDAKYQDFLRRQALWEDLYKIPFGQSSNTFGQSVTQDNQGLFK